MTPEDIFILNFLPILRTYLTHRKIVTLDSELILLERQLKSFYSLKENTDKNIVTHEHSEKSDHSEEITPPHEKLVFDITFRDLQEDVQQFAVDSLGYTDIDSLIEDYPNLDGPICSIEI